MRTSSSARGRRPRRRPLDDPKLQIQPASVDLRLGREFLEFQRTNIPCIHPNSEDEVDDYVTETLVEDGDDFILHPGDFVLGTTHERVEIPDDLIAHVEGAPRWAASPSSCTPLRGCATPGTGARSPSNCRISVPHRSRSPRGCASPSSLSPNSRRPRSGPTVANAARSTKIRTAQASRIQSDDEFGGDQTRARGLTPITGDGRTTTAEHAGRGFTS